MLKVDRRHYSVDKTEAYHDRPHYIGILASTAVNMRSCLSAGQSRGCGKTALLCWWAPSTPMRSSTPQPYRVSLSPMHLFQGSGQPSRRRTWCVLAHMRVHDSVLYYFSLTSSYWRTAAVDCMRARWD